MPKSAPSTRTRATSTLHITLPLSLASHQVWCATLPPATATTKGKQQQKHWLYSAAREQLTLPHCFGPQKCYLLARKGTPAPPPLKLQGYTKACPFLPLTTPATPADRLACMRLLLTHYYVLQQALEHPTSQDHLFLYVRRTKQYRYMLELTLMPDWHLSDEDTLVLHVRDQATRFKELTPQTRYEDERYRKCTPYGQVDLRNSLGEALRPLKQEEVKAAKHLYVHAPSKHHKTHVNLLDIASHTDLIQSRLWKLHHFLQGFIPHLQAMGLQVTQHHRTLQAIPSPKPPAKHAPPPHLAYLPTVRLLDGRKDKRDNTPLAKLRTHCQDLQVSSSLVANDQALMQAKAPTLFLMDYNQATFEEGEEDPYQAFKALGKRHGFPTQALALQGDDKALERKLHVCLSELMLKQYLHQATSPPWPYDQALLKDKVFLHDQHLLYMEAGCLRIMPCHDTEALYVTVAQQTHTPRAQVEEAYKACAHSLKKRHPKKDASTLLADAYLLFAPHTLLEIEKTCERVFYYDLDQLAQRLQARKQEHPKQAFLLQDQFAQAQGITPSQQEAYNAYIKQYAERETSYARLHQKHRKSLLQALEIRKDTKLVHCLAAQGLPLAGKKEGGLFKAYEGIWYDPQAQAYYVGKQLPYNTVQDKGFCTYRIHTHAGTFAPTTYFPLLTVDFVRHKAYTVRPYPFKIIKEYKALHHPST